MTETGGSGAGSTVEVLSTMDAQVWAREFIKTMNEHHCDPNDEGWMLGWFANAIMVGYDTGQNRMRADLEAARGEIERLYALERLWREHVCAVEETGGRVEDLDDQADLAQARARISDLEDNHAECARTADLERAVVDAARGVVNCIDVDDPIPADRIEWHIAGGGCLVDLQKAVRALD